MLPQIPLLLERIVEGEERGALAVGGVDRRVAKRATVQLEPASSGLRDVQANGYSAPGTVASATRPSMLTL